MSRLEEIVRNRGSACFPPVSVTLGKYIAETMPVLALRLAMKKPFRVLKETE
jgi:hypothetical protein